MPFASPDEFSRKRDVLAAHCEAVGRDIEEIECSVQVAWAENKDPSSALEIAKGLKEVGVDTVIFSLRPPYLAHTVEALGKALS